MSVPTMNGATAQRSSRLVAASTFIWWLSCPWLCPNASAVCQTGPSLEGVTLEAPAERVQIRSHDAQQISVVRPDL